MKIEKANNRDKKINKKKYGHMVSNRSIFVIVEVQVKKSRKNKDKKYHG